MSIYCALFRGVFDASVVAVEDQLCVLGFGLSSFCEVIRVSLRSCLCIDDVFFFFFCEGSFSNGFSDWLCYSDTTLKRCVPASVCFLTVECVFCEDCIVFLSVVIGFMPRTSCILILFFFHCCLQGSR